MSNTSMSCLGRLVAGDPEEWQVFPAMYSPFIRGQLSRMLFNKSDVDEIEQEVLVVLVEGIKGFHRQRDGSFRTYLRRICYYKALELLGKLSAGRLPQGTGDSAFATSLHDWADPSSGLSRVWDEDHRKFALDQILLQARKRCGDHKVAVYCELKKKEASREEIASRFNLSLATLFRIQSEVNGVLEQIRQEYADVLDLDELVM